MYYTYNNDSTADYAATWTPSLNSNGSGTYALYVYIPNNHATTTHAVYRIRHNGNDEYITLNQYNISNDWGYLGSFYFNAQGNEYLYLTNLTGESYHSTLVGFDAAKWVKQ